MQSPIFYVIKALIDVKTKYLHLEKLVLERIITTRKLRPYFYCHPIFVVSTFLTKSILHKSKLSEKLIKLVVELSAYAITYQPYTTIKSQVLADFVANFNASILPEAIRRR